MNAGQCSRGGLDRGAAIALCYHQVRVFIDGTVCQCGCADHQAHEGDFCKVQGGMKYFFFPDSKLGNLDAFNLFKFQAQECGHVQLQGELIKVTNDSLPVEHVDDFTAVAIDGDSDAPVLSHHS